MGAENTTGPEILENKKENFSLEVWKKYFLAFFPFEGLSETSDSQKAYDKLIEKFQEIILKVYAEAKVSSADVEVFLLELDNSLDSLARELKSTTENLNFYKI